MTNNNSTKNKSTKRALFLSVVALLLCFTMLLGATSAWFTDSVISGQNTIMSGNLKVLLEYKTSVDGSWTEVTEDTKLFKEGALYEPGYTEIVFLRVSNVGDLALKYNLNLDVLGETTSTNVYDEVFSLKDYLEVGYYVMDESLGQYLLGAMFGTRENALNNVETTKISEESGVIRADAPVLAGSDTAQLVAIVLTMPTSVENDANHKVGVAAPTIELGVSLVATQLMHESDSFGSDFDEDAEYPVIERPWNGTVDISWYNETDTEFELSTAEQLAGLAALVDNDIIARNAAFDSAITFEGKTIKLIADVDLGVIGDNGEPVTFSPIGDKSPFKGTFDGQGHTISNLYQSGWALGYEWGSYGSVGLFGEIESATIKNVTISGAETQIEGGDVGGITGSATGTCVFENITINDSVFATYNNGNGGIIGWSGEGNYTFKNITIAEDVVLAGLWGSFDSSIGGIVGQGEPGATYNFENVDIACRLDVYNDCTASYDYYNYRMCGMIIGRLAETVNIEGTNYPDTSKYDINCTNVTVTYGDWANYHYCRTTGARAQRVESGYSYGGLSADHDHTTCTAHCMELIAFDQIFGGDQYAVKGLKSFDGVEVVYNN